MVDFLTMDGRSLLRVPLAEWLPEAGLVGLLQLSPRECLERTGLPALVAELGVLLEEGDSAASTGHPGADRESGARPDIARYADLAVWHSWVRGLGMLVWFVFFLVVPMLGHGNRWTVLIATTGLFLVPGADLVLRILQRTRTHGDALFAGADVVVPSPESGAGATRRFLDTAALGVLPGDLVLTDTVGTERWLPLRRNQGVTRLVRLVEPSSGAVLGVEFRDKQNAARALLPWRWWFAGPAGAENWSRFVKASGLPVSDENVRHSRDADGWWKNHTMAADARWLAPVDPKRAREKTSWHSTVRGGGEAIVVPILCLIPLLGLDSDQPEARVAGVLAALTILAELVPVVAHRLTSRFQLDRRAEAEAA
ncbi:hypothetical protein ACFWIJ_05245 [Streptomyces sp. NPDC127079]|uniref:hypothetical protein n=1 Tax=Streptomyces sp. NPDC127079 TaxID=3347132 RepID=UPI00366650C2